MRLRVSAVLSKSELELDAFFFLKDVWTLSQNTRDSTPTTLLGGTGTFIVGPWGVGVQNLQGVGGGDSGWVTREDKRQVTMQHPLFFINLQHFSLPPVSLPAIKCGLDRNVAGKN